MNIDVTGAEVPGLWRRLAAIAYDLLLLTALLILASAAVIVPLGLVSGTRIAPGNPLFRLYLLSVILSFFCWFWIRGGQTLGMRAWRIKLVRTDGGEVRLRDALLRLSTALLSLAALGMGYLWILVDKDRLAWHDRLSRTRLVMLRKRKRK